MRRTLLLKALITAAFLVLTIPLAAVGQYERQYERRYSGVT